MENNRYAQYKKEIREISEAENVDIGMACAMLRDRMGWHFDGPDKELTEFTAYVQDIPEHERKAFFEG